MSAPPRRKWTREDYDRDAREYLAGLPLEHFMGATAQATQREITLNAFALLRRRRGGLAYFSELLVQYLHGDERRRVVPDNMLVLGDPGDRPRTSYPLELEPCLPFWVLEYVSEADPTKDYVRSFEIYEQHIGVPYYLIYDPDGPELNLYQRRGARYAPVRPNEQGRLPIPDLEVEVALVGGWARYYFRGELLPVTAELEQQMAQLRDRVQQLTNLNDMLSGHNHRLASYNRRLTDENAALADEVTRARQERDALGALLRPLVEAKARKAGRDDILARLPGEQAPDQLTRWLAELG